MLAMFAMVQALHTIAEGCWNTANVLPKDEPGEVLYPSHQSRSKLSSNTVAKWLQKAFDQNPFSRCKGLH